jgi:hypothetical protein
MKKWYPPIGGALFQKWMEKVHRKRWNGQKWIPIKKETKEDGSN